MTSPAVSLQNWFFAVDDVDNIGSDVMVFATSPTGFATGATGTPVTKGVDPNLDTYLAAITPHPPTGMTRYWWSLLIGPGQTISPARGTSKIYGQLTAAPGKPVYDWTITIRN